MACGRVRCVREDRAHGIARCEPGPGWRDVAHVVWTTAGDQLITMINPVVGVVVHAIRRRHDLDQLERGIGEEEAKGLWEKEVKELLAESFVLAVAGGLAGLALAYGALGVLIALAPANLPRLSAISIDGSVLLFTVGVSVLSGLVSGIVPVLKYAGANLGTTLRAGGRTASASGWRPRRCPGRRA